MITVNAMGKACPEPVIMTKAALDKGASELEVYVDNPIAATNVKRFLEGKGFSVLLRDDEGRLTVIASPKAQKTEEVAPVVTAVNSSSIAEIPRGKSQTFSVLITARTLGRDDEQLGEILIKGFLGTLSQLDTAPKTVALMNEGVKLALFDSSSCDYLKILEQKGTSVLVCGTCVNHFGINSKVGVGVISNMFEIVDAILKADKTISV